MTLKLLITGSTGYLGQRLAKHYLNTTDESLLLLVRAKHQSHFEEKVATLKRSLDAEDAETDRVSFCPMDLSTDNPFDSLAPNKIKRIIHTAAITRFDVSKEDADQVNKQGTLKLLQFADTCPHLERIGLLSTVYTSGLRPGSIVESPLDQSHGFANFYEWSKWEAERYALDQFSHLPWTLFRVATVVADQESGKVVQFNVFHNTMRLMHQGLLTLLPGRDETPIYLVTGEFVTDSIASILGLPFDREQRIYHLAHPKERSLTLGGLIDTAFTTFKEDNQFVKKHVKKPRYISLETFELFTNQVNSFGSQANRLATASMKPFARQLYIAKEVDNARLVARLPQYNPLDSRELVVSTCRYLMKTNWSKPLSVVV